MRQLRSQFREVLGWVTAGEEVVISVRGKVIARLVPAVMENVKPVDWQNNAAARMDKTALPLLLSANVQKLVCNE